MREGAREKISLQRVDSKETNVRQSENKRNRKRETKAKNKAETGREATEGRIT